MRSRRFLGGSPATVLALLAVVGPAVVSRAQQPSTVASGTPADTKADAGGFLGNLSFGSQRGPVTIEAERLEFDYRTRELTYRGSVSVTQGDLSLRSNELKVFLEGETAMRIREVVASGSVRIAQGDRVATGGRAVFDETARTVVLSGDAVLKQGQNELRGESVVVYLDEERSVVEGGQQRVRAVLFPSSGGAADRHDEER